MRYVVIGGGIVGLAVAHRLLSPGGSGGSSGPSGAVTVTVVEKEDRWGAHQTGHNSGVVHAGVYYKPGSLKARLCRAGSASMVAFCREYGLPVDVCGKLIVATSEDEVPRLHALYERAKANRLPVTLVTDAQAREYEPAVSCVAAMHVASTGIVDYGAVCRQLATLVEQAGGALMLGTRVVGIKGTVVQTTAGDVQGDVVINCAGLYADKIARMAGVRVPVRIVPFRGEYYELTPDRRDLVRGLIYPVPDPRFPFLGVHLTRMVDGGVHAGPNAVLALAREGYRWRDIRPGEAIETLAYPGLWKLGRRNLGYGLGEVRRSLSKRRFAASLARLVPLLMPDDLVPAESGVRAQAIDRDGALVDDFLIVREGPQVHVLNAPSPAATSALEIAKHIVAGLGSS